MIFAHDYHSLNSYLSGVLNNLLKAYSHKMALHKQLKNLGFILGGPHKMRCILKYILPTLLSLVLFQNCTNDKIPPTIFIESPQENTVYTLNQTVPILAELTDNNDIESASITLYNPNNEPVKSLFYNNLSTSYYYIEHNLELDSSFESSTYIIKISATDGTNAASSSLSINILGTNNQSESNWLFGANNQATSQFYYVTNTNEQVIKTAYFNFNKQVTSSDLLTSVFFNQSTGESMISCYNNLYGPVSNPLVTQSVNEIQTVSASGNYVAQIDFIGNIQIYTNYGALLSSGYVPSGYIAEASEICGNYLLVNAFSSESKLYVYYIPTGNLISSYTLDGRLINAFSQPNEHVQIFTYNAGELSVSTLSINQGTFSDFKSFTCNTPIKIIKKSNEIFALINGTLYSTESLFSSAGLQPNTNFKSSLTGIYYSDFYELFIANTTDSMFVYNSNYQLQNSFKLKEPNTIGLPIIY